MQNEQTTMLVPIIIPSAYGKRELESYHYTVDKKGKEYYIINNHFIPAELMEDNEWID